jgi:hypothetical protein
MKKIINGKMYDTATARETPARHSENTKGASTMIIRAYDESQNPVTVSLIGDRHLVVNGKEITSTRDLSFDKQRMADRACDDLYDCPIFDGKRIITTTMPNSATAYAWQLAEQVDDRNKEG